MTMTAAIHRSPITGKKWRVEFSDGHTVDFGAAGYQDFTQHGDPARRKAYIARHASREHWRDPRTAGFWARWLLWERPTMRAAAREIHAKFGIQVVVARHMRVE